VAVLVMVLMSLAIADVMQPLSVGGSGPGGAPTLAFLQWAIPAAISLGSSLFGRKRGGGGGGRYEKMLRGELDRETPEAAQNYLLKTLRSYESQGMPQFQSGLQDIRENAVRRGITGGDLGTSYEGDLASAFQRNLMDVGGRYAFDAYQQSRGRRLDLLTSQLDRETARKNAQRDMWGNLIGSGLQAFGTFAGAKWGK
jgi:hypothetical protein